MPLLDPVPAVLYPMRDMLHPTAWAQSALETLVRGGQGGIASTELDALRCNERPPAPGPPAGRAFRGSALHHPQLDVRALLRDG